MNVATLSSTLIFKNKEHFEYLNSSSATKLAPAAPVEVRGTPPARPRLPGAARLGRGRGLGPRPPGTRWERWFVSYQPESSFGTLVIGWSFVETMNLTQPKTFWQER